MASIDTAYKMTAFILNKVQAGNASPARFNLAADMANRSLFKRYMGVPEIADRGGNAMTFSESTDIQHVMRLFEVPTTLFVNNLGVASLPSDFIRESTLTYVVQSNGVTDYNPIKICNDQEFQESQYSYLVPATKDNPVVRFTGTTAQFLPKNLITVQMTYLRMPKTPVWGYTLTSNRPVYDPTTSTDIEFPDDVLDDYVMLIIENLGLSIQRGQLVSYTNAYKMGGQ